MIKTQRIHILPVVLTIVFFLGLGNITFAAPPKKEDKAKEKTEEKVEKKEEKLIKHTTDAKEIVGEVTWIGKDHISVLFSADDASGTEYEMLIPFEKNVAIDHKRNLGEIKTGDTVRIKYEEDLKQYDTAREEISRKAKVIGFVKAGAKKAAPGEAVVQSEPQAGQ